MKTELNKVANISNGEITLFREMSNILSSQHNVSFIEETHQHYVEFASPRISQTATREISDLWIIAFSPTKHKARMTFLQAKYHRGNLDQNNTEFYGDYFQYELLAKRPAINYVGIRINLPTDILAAHCLPSVGSYGVFFIDNANQIDLAYCSADYLTPATIPTHYAALPNQVCFLPVEPSKHGNMQQLPSWPTFNTTHKHRSTKPNCSPTNQRLYLNKFRTELRDIR